jgi:hypothetical protein
MIKVLHALTDFGRTIPENVMISVAADFGGGALSVRRGAHT